MELNMWIIFLAILVVALIFILSKPGSIHSPKINRKGRIEFYSKGMDAGFSRLTGWMAMFFTFEKSYCLSKSNTGIIGWGAQAATSARRPTATSTCARRSNIVSSSQINPHCSQSLVLGNTGARRPMAGIWGNG